jgi:hypothetical protein
VLLVGTGTPEETAADLACMSEAIAAVMPYAETSPLVGEDATAARINLAIRDLAASQAGLTIFYFTGHGLRTGTESYLCGSDSMPGNEGVPLYLLVRQLTELGPDRSWLAILDCCHGTPDNVHTSGVSAAHIQAAMSGYIGNRAVLAAAAPEGLALRIDGKGSPFTLSVAAGLKGGAANALGEVTAAALHHHVDLELSELGYPRPTLVCDQADRFTIAVDLPARGKRPLSEEDTAGIIAKAVAMPDNLRPYFRPSEPDWKQEGWLRASQALRPAVIWFDRVSANHPQLALEPEFTGPRDALDRYLATLAQVEMGIETPYGVIGRPIGGGGFGVVWELGEDRAIKVFHAHEMHRRDKRSRFERGYRAMEQLDQGVVKVLHYLQTPPAILMDLVAGGNLAKLGPFGLIDGLELIAGIGRALVYAHSHGVVHRDLKPENVLLQDGLPLLTDFDLAWFPGATSLTVAPMNGSPYAAPEQVRGDKQSQRHARVDVYALGQLLYFVLTGKPPNAGNALANARVLVKNLTFAGDGSPSPDMLIQIYDRAIHAEPKGRFPTMADMVAELERLLTDKQSHGELTFRVFCSNALGRAKAEIDNSPKAFKVYAKSRSQRTTVELILRSDGPVRGHLVQARFKVYDFLGQNVPRSYARMQKINQCRVDAMMDADPEAYAVKLKSGAYLVELQTLVPELSLEEARTFGRRLQSIIYAGERIT